MKIATITNVAVTSSNGVKDLWCTITTEESLKLPSKVTSFFPLSNNGREVREFSADLSRLRGHEHEAADKAD